MSPASCCCRYIALPVKEAVTSISIWLFRQNVYHAVHPGLPYLTVQCLRSNCGSVWDGTDFNRDLYRGHISFALLASLYLLGYKRAKYFKKQIPIFPMNLPSLAGNGEKDTNCRF